MVVHWAEQTVPHLVVPKVALSVASKDETSVAQLAV